ncbi:unnamed protein product [Schistosoma rodhaini]|uniref:Opioid-binding protein/cell adhesion molecule n=1 Tax=Schistosoma rodhaini TaxID=6188 RepID=A0AA85EYN5_9TREM|nr:unnamed protein product [Schistosoma rodhaini]
MMNLMGILKIAQSITVEILLLYVSLTEVKQNVYETNMNISVKNGSMAELSCPIDIVLTRKDLLKTKALSLYLRPTLPDDEGEYKCTLILKDKIHVHTVSLNISVPPIIIKSPVPYLKVDEGSSLELNCLATGNPPPHVTWKVFSNPLIKDDKTDQKLLSIYDAFSGLGVLSPEVKMTNRIIKQGIGMNTVLTCQVSAHPPGSIRWLFNHHYPIAATSCDVMTNSEKKYCLQEHRPQSYNGLSAITSKLAIFNLKVGDFGDYVCSVSTIMGESFGVTTLQRFKTERFDTDLAQIMHQKQIERLSDKQVTRDRISNSHDNYYNKYLKRIRLSEDKVYQRPIDTQNTVANATFTVQLYIKLLMVFNMLTVISHFLYF